jgi:hypothetical protein
VLLSFPLFSSLVFLSSYPSCFLSFSAIIVPFYPVVISLYKISFRNQKVTKSLWNWRMFLQLFPLAPQFPSPTLIGVHG